MAGLARAVKRGLRVKVAGVAKLARVGWVQRAARAVVQRAAPAVVQWAARAALVGARRARMVKHKCVFRAIPKRWAWVFAKQACKHAPMGCSVLALAK